MFSNTEENNVGKGEIARYEQFLLFPHCFQNICTADTRHLKTGPCLAKVKRCLKLFDLS